MKISTLICAGAFLFFVVHGEYKIPGIRPSKENRREAQTRAQATREIERRIDEVRAIIKRLDRSERMLTQRLEEIRKNGSRTSSGRDARYWNRADEMALLEQLKGVCVERETAKASLERLKTEQVKIEVRQDMLRTAAERRSIDGFLDGNGGPMEGIADDLELWRAAVESGEIVYDSR